eukprot:15483272-Alexandrium_andersonii.AAC.1
MKRKNPTKQNGGGGERSPSAPRPPQASQPQEKSELDSEIDRLTALRQSAAKGEKDSAHVAKI